MFILISRYYYVGNVYLPCVMSFYSLSISHNCTNDGWMAQLCIQWFSLGFLLDLLSERGVYSRHCSAHGATIDIVKVYILKISISMGVTRRWSFSHSKLAERISNDNNIQVHKRLLAWRFDSVGSPCKWKNAVGNDMHYFDNVSSFSSLLKLHNMLLM